MKKINLNVEQVNEEWKETFQAIPPIREQLNTRVKTIFSQEEITDQDMDNLENAFLCIQKLLEYFPATIRSYSRRCGKISGLDTAENLERLKAIRESAELEIANIDSIKESVFRKLSLRRMEQGIFTLPQPEQQKDAQFPSASDEESGE